MARTLFVAIVAALGTAACGEVARTGRAPVVLVVNSLEASAGQTDEFGTFLQSDVQTAGSITNDVGRATFTIIAKNPGSVTNTLAPTDLNTVVISRYRVRFFRADGRNTPGVDVPHGFDAGLTVTVTGEGSTTAGFDLVRHEMKLEPPISNLRFASGVAFINTIAEITFYGRDLAGNDVSASGTISVNFADFADPE